MLASMGFPVPLPYDVSQHILSYIPPVWTEITRDTVVPPDGYFKMVPHDSRYKYKFARFYLLNPLYGFQAMKRGEINFAICEAELFMRFRNLPIPEQITIGDIMPVQKCSQALEDLWKFNYDMIMLSML